MDSVLHVGQRQRAPMRNNMGSEGALDGSKRAAGSPAPSASRVLQVGQGQMEQMEQMRMEMV